MHGGSEVGWTLCSKSLYVREGKKVLETWLLLSRDGTKKRLHPCALFAPRMFGRVASGDNLEENYIPVFLELRNALSAAVPVHIAVVCIYYIDVVRRVSRCRTFAEQAPLARGRTGTPVSWASAHVTTRCTLEMVEQAQQHFKISICKV